MAFVFSAFGDYWPLALAGDLYGAILVLGLVCELRAVRARRSDAREP